MIRIAAFADEASPSLEGQIAALQRNGISLIEVRALNGVNVRDLSEQEARAHAARLAAAEIEVWAIGSPLGKVELSCDFEAYQGTVRHICRLAQIFGTDKIRIFSFFEAYDDKARVVAYLREMVRVAAAYGVTLYHENEKKVFGDTAARVCELAARVPGLRFVFDPANFLEAGEDLAAALAVLHGKSDYFHVKDLIFSTSERVPAGCGDAMIGELIERVGDRDRVLTLEPHLMVFEGFAEIDGGELHSRFRYADANAAFDAAASSLKALLTAHGYTYNEKEGGFERI